MEHQGAIIVTYRLSAKFYDLFGEKDDLGFYEELARQSGKNALELGVGTARVAIHLAQAGIRVVGIDNSDFMLQEARRKLAKAPRTVRANVILKKADIRNFRLAQSFSFIYVPASTFTHCVTRDDQVQCLSRVHQHLEDKGRFVFDVNQPSDKSATSWWIDRKEKSRDEMIVRSIFTTRNFQKRLCSLDLFFDVYKKGKLAERYHEFGEVAILSKKELTDLLNKTGFEVETMYGNFDKSPYSRNSSKMILVTKKRPKRGRRRIEPLRIRSPSPLEPLMLLTVRVM